MPNEQEFERSGRVKPRLTFGSVIKNIFAAGLVLKLGIEIYERVVALF